MFCCRKPRNVWLLGLVSDSRLRPSFKYSPSKAIAKVNKSRPYSRSPSNTSLRNSCYHLAEKKKHQHSSALKCMWDSNKHTHILWLWLYLQFLFPPSINRWTHWGPLWPDSGFLPQSKDMQVKSIGHSKLSIGVKTCLFVSLCQPCDEQVLCPWCTACPMWDFLWQPCNGDVKNMYRLTLLWLCCLVCFVFIQEIQFTDNVCYNYYYI